MRTVRQVVTPNFPIAPTEYSQRYQDQFINILRLYSNTVSSAINSPRPYGSFYDTTTQTNPVANGVNLMRLNSTVQSYNTYVGSPLSRVYVTETGVYNIQFSAQADKTGGSADTMYIWLRINGSSIPYSAGKVVVNGPNAEVIPSWNYVTPLSAGDYVELAWSSPDVDMVLLAVTPSGSVPDIPSVILTVTWLSNIAL